MAKKTKPEIEEIEFKEPSRKQSSLKSVSENLPTIEYQTNEIRIQDGSEIVGIVDGFFDRELQEENPYTGLKTSPQLGLIQEGLEEGGESDYIYVWLTPGLIHALEDYEVIPGMKISIKRKGSEKNTRWIIKTF